MNYSSKQLLTTISSGLQSVYDPEEARTIAFIVLGHFFKLTRSAVLADKPIDIQDISFIQQVIDRLNKHEPVQYVIGQTEFLGRVFEVNKHVLIPRPETEELVSLILHENKYSVPSKVIDIGTGSGCIAISLAAAWTQAQVTALDVSAEALRVAQGNAVKYVQNVKFMQADILKVDLRKKLPAMQLDVVVSNPPYVTYAEEPLMRKNVTDYEPHLALFVEDTDPLLFYKHIALFCMQHLKKGGICYVETNEQYAKEVSEVFLSNNFSNAAVSQDMFGKNRFVKGIF